MLRLDKLLAPSLFLAWLGAAPTVRADPAAKPEKHGHASSKDPKTAKPAETAPELADRVQRFYDRTEDFVTDFVQIYTRVALSRSQESRGTLQIKKPGMMRWDYVEPTEKHLVADGKQLYTYDPEEEQIIRDTHFKISELGTSLGFLWGKGKLSDSFEITLGDSKMVEGPANARVLELKPKADATFTKMVLIVDPVSGQVLESILFETSGNTNRFKFRNLRTNLKLGPETFQFKAPPGVPVIDRP